MQKSSLAKVFGCASVVLSLVPWIVIGMSFIPLFSGLDLTATQITLFLGAGVLLAFIAAACGSGRWAFVALFDLGTFFLLVFLLNLREPH